MDAYETILKRRSVRKFKPEPVSRDLLSKVVEAGRLAPTARNEQPWEFIVVTEPERCRHIAGLTDTGKFIADAQACIVVVSHPAKYYIEDGSAATTQMMLAATALGLGSCWVAGDKKAYADKVAAYCGVPADFKLVALIAVGWPAEVPSPPKRSLDDVTHWETLG